CDQPVFVPADVEHRYRQPGFQFNGIGMGKRRTDLLDARPIRPTCDLPPRGKRFPGVRVRLPEVPQASLADHPHEYIMSSGGGGSTLIGSTRQFTVILPCARRARRPVSASRSQSEQASSKPAAEWW